MKFLSSLTVFCLTLYTTKVSPSPNDLQTLDTGFEEVDEFSHESLNFYTPKYGDTTDQIFKNLSIGLWQSLESSPQPTNVPATFNFKHKTTKVKQNNNNNNRKQYRKHEQQRHQRQKKNNYKASTVMLEPFVGGKGGKQNYSKKNSQRGQRLKNNKNGNLFPHTFVAVCTFYRAQSIMFFLL